MTPARLVRETACLVRSGRFVSVDRLVSIMPWPPPECAKLQEDYKVCFAKSGWNWGERTEEQEKCDDVFTDLQDCIKAAMEKKQDDAATPKKRER